MARSTPAQKPRGAANRTVSGILEIGRFSGICFQKPDPA
jgi:hypothetical protein